MLNPIPAAILAALASEHSAWLGMTGSGKTYGAKGAIVEPALDAGRRVVIVDPTSAWYGLRLQRDGRTPAFPVTIFGGRHGDMPLDERSGAALGELVAKDNVPAIMDVRHLGVGERTRWFTDFADAILRSNVGPLTLVIDEAHRFAPQARTLDPHGARMLHMAESLASGGRSLGIRLVVISQRPAKVHKDVLTSCGALAAFRVTSPQDRRAIEEWIEGEGDPVKGAAVLSSLAKLKDGETWLWVPRKEYLERVKMPAITTFDSSATPNDDSVVPPPSLMSPERLADLKAKLGAAVETAAANDPKALRARIRELEDKAAAAAPAPGADVVERAQVIVGAAVSRANRIGSHLTDVHAKIEGYASEAAGALSRVSEIFEALAGLVRDSRGTLAQIEPGPAGTVGVQSAQDLMTEFCSGPLGEPHVPRAGASPKPSPRTDFMAPAVVRSGNSGDRVVSALAFWAGIGVNEPDRFQVGILARVNPAGGHFDKVVRPLVEAGKVERNAGTLRLLAPVASAVSLGITTLRAYHQHVLSQLDGSTLRMLEVIVAGGGDRCHSRDGLGKASGVNPAGGHFDKVIRPLAALRLIRRSNGNIFPTETLFPRGLK